MASYYFVNLEDSDYEYYAVVSFANENSIHIYYLDPLQGSKEMALKYAGNMAEGLKIYVEDDTPDVNVILDELQKGTTGIKAGGGEKINLREGVIFVDFENGARGVLLPHYYPDSLGTEGIEPSGTYDVQIYPKEGEMRFYSIECDSDTNLYLPEDEDEAVDSLELDEINEAIKGVR